MSASAKLKELADLLYEQGLEKHAEATALVRASARLDQASRILNEEQAQVYLRGFLSASLDRAESDASKN